MVVHPHVLPPRTTRAWPMLAAALAGCGAPAIEGPSPPGLAYDLPRPNPATYTFSDTADFSIQAGAMGTLDLRVGQSGVAELEFRRDVSGFEVMARFPEYSASFQAPNQGITRADEEGIQGPIVVSLDARGAVAVVDTPYMNPAVLEVSGPESLVRPLFVHLPGREVEPGARWVDTVTTVEEGPETTSRGRSIITSTLRGDTLVAGDRLLVITTESDNLIELTGTSGGVEIRQRLTGTTRGRILWDPQRHLLVERHEEGRLTGTLELPGMGAEGLPVSGQIVRRISLRE